jgi:hypothetical protein
MGRQRDEGMHGNGHWPTDLNKISREHRRLEAFDLRRLHLGFVAMRVRVQWQYYSCTDDLVDSRGLKVRASLGRDSCANRAKYGKENFVIRRRALSQLRHLSLWRRAVDEHEPQEEGQSFSQKTVGISPIA